MYCWFLMKWLGYFRYDKLEIENIVMLEQK
jgi:hypothetical protein